MAQMSPVPARLPIPLPQGVYYGWVIIAVVWLANFIGATMNPVVFSMFIDPMRKDLGVNLGTMAWAITLSQVAAGLAAPLMGRLIDQYGTQWMGAATGVICGAALISLYFADNIWIMYLRFALTGITGLGTFGGNLITIVPPGNWFVIKRGRATAIANTGGGLGTAVFVSLAAFLIYTVGWRMTWVIFGVAIWALIIPSYGLLMRRRPEDLGLKPDGIKVEAGAASGPSGAGAPPRTAPVEIDWTPKQATRAPVLWGMIAAVTVYGFSSSAILFMRVPFWNTLEVAPQSIALAVSTDPFMVMIFGLVFGFLAERYAIRFMAVAGGIARAISMLPLLFSPGYASSVFLHNVTWGIGSAGFITAQNLIIPAYFGRLAQGAIRGIQVPFNIAAAALGAPVAGYLVDAGMDISLVWQAALVMMLGPGLAFFFFKPPKPPVD